MLVSEESLLSGYEEFLSGAMPFFFIFDAGPTFFDAGPIFGVFLAVDLGVLFGVVSIFFLLLSDSESESSEFLADLDLGPGRGRAFFDFSTLDS